MNDIVCSFGGFGVFFGGWGPVDDGGGRDSCVGHFGTPGRIAADSKEREIPRKDGVGLWKWLETREKYCSRQRDRREIERSVLWQAAAGGSGSSGDGARVLDCSRLAGRVSQGETQRCALGNLSEAIEAYLGARGADRLLKREEGQYARFETG